MPRTKPRVTYAICSTVDGKQIRVFRGVWARVIAALALGKAKVPNQKPEELQ
jgi:hypothetical protein